MADVVLVYWAAGSRAEYRPLVALKRGPVHKRPKITRHLWGDWAIPAALTSLQTSALTLVPVLANPNRMRRKDFTQYDFYIGPKVRPTPHQSAQLGCVRRGLDRQPSHLTVWTRQCIQSPHGIFPREGRAAVVHQLPAIDSGGGVLVAVDPKGLRMFENPAECVFDVNR